MTWMIWLVLLIPPSPSLGGAAPVVSSREAWRALPAERRGHILRNYSRYRAMSPRTRRLLRRRFEAFKALPAQEREEIASRWRSLRLAPGGWRQAREGLGRAERDLRAAERSRRLERGERGGRQFRGRD